MSKRLAIKLGHYSDKGRKEVNQDFLGAYIPNEPLLSAKGIALAIADGISSSDVSQEASAAAVSSFLEDYYCTSEAWSVKTSAQKVILAINSWLYAQTRKSQYRYEQDRGYVCTFSALVFKSTTAHILHAGDARISRLQGGQMEQLTEDHRLRMADGVSYLNRALGMNTHLEIDYHALPLEEGDVFVLSTDGVHEYASQDFIIHTLAEHAADLDRAARLIIDEALNRGSTDNLTLQIARVEQLPSLNADELYQQLTDKPFPPSLEPRKVLDGYEIIRDIHISSRSHVYLARDIESGTQVILKAPSVDLRNHPAYLERFLMEEWVARRINNAHVLRPCNIDRRRNYLYTVTELIEGQTLAQWLRDHPRPSLETVRGIIEQIAKGLRAFHRQEMLHQDLRPDNIMIDRSGTVKIIDFGATRVAGLMEITSPLDRDDLPGTGQYMAPEYLLGEAGSPQSDLFSLGVITYQMLSGRLPYGMQVVKSRTKAAQNKLTYRSVLDDEREIPAWVDEAIKKAVHPDRYKRHAEISEFVYELRHPNQAYLNKTRPPLLERDPLLFWKGVSFLLACIIIALLANQHAERHTPLNTTPTPSIQGDNHDPR